MPKKSSKQFFSFIPSDQRNALVLALIAILTLIATIVPIVLATVPHPYSYIILPITMIALGAFFLISYVKTIIRKQLLFEFTDHQPILENLTFSPSIPINIFYNNIPVLPHQLHTVYLKIENVGNTKIEKGDFNQHPVVVNLPEEIRVLDVALKDKSRQGITLDKPKKTTEHSVSIEPFSLAVHEWFKIRFTLFCTNQGLINKLKEADIPPDNFAFTTFRFHNHNWEEEQERRAKRRNRILFIPLLILSVLSVALFVYVWFFSGNISFFTLPFQLFLAAGIAALWFGLVISIIINNITPAPLP